MSLDSQHLWPKPQHSVEEKQRALDVESDSLRQTRRNARRVGLLIWSAALGWKVGGWQGAAVSALWLFWLWRTV